MSVKKAPKTRTRRASTSAIQFVNRNVLAPMIQGAVDQMFRKRGMGSQTETQRKKKQKTSSSRRSSSYSGGFFKANKRATAQFTGGIKLTLERGGVLNTKWNSVTAGPTVIVGHANIAADRVLDMVWRSIVLDLAQAVGLRCTDPNVDIFGNTGDQILVRYFPDREIDTAPTSFPINIPALLKSVNTIGFELKNWWLTLGDQAMLDSIEFIPASNQTASPSNLTRHFTKLQRSRVSIYCKSTLKIQNRTVNDVGDDADDVDTVPLYGKSYEGSGNGMRSIALAANQSFISDDLYGDIWKQDTLSSAAGVIREPPPPSAFVNVSKHGKVRVEPGQIKTSSLVFRRNMDLDTFLKMFQQQDTVSGGQTYVKLGKFRVMVLEKMIQVGNFTDDQGILLGYEVNNFYHVKFTANRTHDTVITSDLGNVNQTVQ